MMDNKSIIEALLFTYGKPLSVDKISEIIGESDRKLIRAQITELQMEYETNDKAVTIVEVAGGFQIVTKPQYSEWIKKLYKTKIISRLSRPALETVAIVAYKQPITRLEIEDIRGVSTEGVIQTLLERGLIKIRGRKDTVGRPLLYCTTNEFLEYFGLKDLSDMPKLEEIPATVSTDAQTNNSQERVTNDSDSRTP